MEPHGPQGRQHERIRKGGIGPDSIEGAITRPAGLTDDGAVINPLVASGTEGTVDVAGTLFIIGTFVSGLGICS